VHGDLRGMSENALAQKIPQFATFCGFSGAKIDLLAHR